MKPYDVLVVGASISGLATAETLRRRGFQGTIGLVDAEPYLPYDKPPLSKKALTNGWAPTKASLRPAHHYERLGIDLILGSSAVSLDGSGPAVTLASGVTVEAREVVVATGARPRRLPDQELDGVLTLRGLDDALELRESLGPGRRLVVVGGGFIGAEVAAAARQESTEVTVIEALPSMFCRALGTEVGTALAETHRRHGVQIECGVGVAAVEDSADGLEVTLTDGRRLPSDVVLAGLGVEPAVEWLEGSGVRVEDGVLCDTFGRTSVPHVHAAGDVAAWYNDRNGDHIRCHHWTLAREQGVAVGRALLGDTDAEILSPVPYFWSDQYDLRLQSFGEFAEHDRCELVWGAYKEEKFVTRYYRDGRLIGAVGINAARELRAHHAEIQRQLAAA